MSSDGTVPSAGEAHSLTKPRPKVVLEGVERRYGDVLALAALDLAVHEGEFLTLLGPSGCGKTTTLRIIAGFVGHLPPNKREVGMVFQNYALLPHLTVADNIAFGMKQRGASKAARAARVAELLDLIQLAGYEPRYPAELSGGQRQRVAIARAVAHPPAILLMDEPLGALDLKLREAMQQELRAIQKRLCIAKWARRADRQPKRDLPATRKPVRRLVRGRHQLPVRAQRQRPTLPRQRRTDQIAASGAAVARGADARHSPGVVAHTGTGRGHGRTQRARRAHRRKRVHRQPCQPESRCRRRHNSDPAWRPRQRPAERRRERPHLMVT